MKTSTAVTLLLMGVGAPMAITYCVMTPGDDTARDEARAKAQYLPKDAIPEDELVSAPAVVQRQEERRSSGGSSFIYVPVHTYSSPTMLPYAGSSSGATTAPAQARTAPAPAPAAPAAPSSTTTSSRGGFGATGSGSSSGGSS